MKRKLLVGGVLLSCLVLACWGMVQNSQDPGNYSNGFIISTTTAPICMTKMVNIISFFYPCNRTLIRAWVEWPKLGYYNPASMDHLLFWFFYERQCCLYACLGHQKNIYILVYGICYCGNIQSSIIGANIAVRSSYSGKLQSYAFITGDFLEWDMTSTR